MDFGKNASFSKYKKLLGKVFGFSNSPDEEDKAENEEDQQDDKSLGGMLSKEMGAMKTLVLDLSNVVTHLKEVQGKPLLNSFTKQLGFDRCMTSIKILCRFAHRCS